MAGVGNNTETAGGKRLQHSLKKGENILPDLVLLWKETSETFCQVTERWEMEIPCSVLFPFQTSTREIQEAPSSIRTCPTEEHSLASYFTASLTRHRRPRPDTKALLSAVLVLPTDLVSASDSPGSAFPRKQAECCEPAAHFPNTSSPGQRSNTWIIQFLGSFCLLC